MGAARSDVPFGSQPSDRVARDQVKLAARRKCLVFVRKAHRFCNRPSIDEVHHDWKDLIELREDQPRDGIKFFDVGRES